MISPIKQKLVFLSIALSLYSVNVVADLPKTQIPNINVRASSNGSTQVNIRGVVISKPPCVIGEDEIRVDFKDVLRSRIDGHSYKRERINYTINCGAQSPNALELSITSASTADFDPESLATTIPGLGIAIFYDNKKLAVGQKISFTYPNYPKLEVVPVISNSGVQDTGPFEATGTLLVNYR